MITIDENQLKLLLERRKSRLEQPRYNGTGEIISAISLSITLFLADFSNLTFIKPLYFKIIAWSVTVGILVYGIYIFVKSITGFYSIDDLYSEISDIDPNIEHPFNILVIRDTQKSGRYLVFKNKRWNCWLFPNYHCLNGEFKQTKELQYIKRCMRRDLNILEDYDIKYVGNKISHKYSFGDKVNKKL